MKNEGSIEVSSESESSSSGFRFHVGSIEWLFVVDGAPRFEYQIEISCKYKRRENREGRESFIGKQTESREGET